MQKLALPALSIVTLLAAAGIAPADDDFVSRMEREHADDRPVSSPAAEEAPDRPVTAESVVYATLDGKEVSGYLAKPEGKGPGLPAILLIHEWWGLNENIESMARRFAGEGFVALAVDLYEGEVATTREEASRLARGSGERRARLVENLGQALDYLAAQEAADVGVVGWCFGGGWSLRTALAFPDRVSAATIYYGRLITDKESLGALRAPILGLFGETDQGIPVATVREFESALESLGKSARIHVYPGAGHAFANPSGTRYDAAAADDAWAKTLAFFDGYLR